MTIDWIDVIYILVLPLIQQLIKLLSEQFGIVLDKWHNQLITLVVAIVVSLLGGEFMGLEWQGWDGDLMSFINANLITVGAMWAVISASYEVVWDRFYGLLTDKSPLRLVTKDKL